ncbi:MAG: hypothetical protein WKF35_06770 [Ferruginibacter sp.]
MNQSLIIYVLNINLHISKSAKNIIIKKITCWLLLCTFILSIAPKQLLHNLFAPHNDISVKKTSDCLQINKAIYNCDCNSITATSAFTASSARYVFETTLPFNNKSEVYRSSLYIIPSFYFNLRGPPSIV